METREAIRVGLEKALIGCIEHDRRQAQKPRHRLLVDGNGVPMFHTVRDKLGDIMRVYRAHPVANRDRSKYDGETLRAIRAEKGVGRPPGIVSQYQTAYMRAPLHIALHDYGSQRAAAKALGLNLSTFQRRLAKEAVAA